MFILYSNLFQGVIKTINQALQKAGESMLLSHPAVQMKISKWAIACQA